MKQLTANEYLVLTLLEHKFLMQDKTQIYIESTDIITELWPVVKISRGTIATILRKLQAVNIIKLVRIKGYGHAVYQGEKYYEYTSKIKHMIPT